MLEVKYMNKGQKYLALSIKMVKELQRKGLLVRTKLGVSVNTETIGFDITDDITLGTSYNTYNEEWLDPAEVLSNWRGILRYQQGIINNYTGGRGELNEYTTNLSFALDDFSRVLFGCYKYEHNVDNAYQFETTLMNNDFFEVLITILTLGLYSVIKWFAKYFNKGAWIDFLIRTVNSYEKLLNEFIGIMNDYQKTSDSKAFSNELLRIKKEYLRDAKSRYINMIKSCEDSKVRRTMMKKVLEISKKAIRISKKSSGVKNEYKMLKGVM